MSSAADRYQFGGGVVLAVRGDRRARAHFRAEYAAAASGNGSTAPAAVELSIGARIRIRADAAAELPQLNGAHKAARWRVFLPADLSSTPLRTAVEVRGPLGLSLVQGYVIEPLLSIAAARAGLVLLPAAAIVQPSGALLLIGRSRSGKSTLVARALAAGREVLGDDQVLLTASGSCLRFPRRLRLYSDLARTAPAAHAALPAPRRGALAARGFVRALTRGYVAPPLRVALSELRCARYADESRIHRVIVIRRAAVDELVVEPLSAGDLAADAADALEEQRATISRAGVSAWSDVLERVQASERAQLKTVLAAFPAQRMSVPHSWTAERAVTELARQLGLD